MNILLAVLSLSLLGFGIEVIQVEACDKYTDCLCEGTDGNNPPLAYACAEIYGNGTVKTFPEPTGPDEDAERDAGVGGACTPSETIRKCWCDMNIREDGGTCVYSRTVPPTGAPTSTLPSISQSPSVSAQPSVSVSAQPSVSLAPSTTTRPTNSQSPSVSAQPSISAEPSISASPSISQSPSVSTQPSVSAQPSVSLAPSTTTWPTTSQSPNVSAHPSESTQPSVSAQPSISLEPSTTTWPTISQSPSVSAQPTQIPSVSTQPSVSAQPSVSLAPSTTAWPTTSQSPSVSTQPSVSAQPSVSLAPSTTTWPTISQSPSVSAHPSVSAQPSISLGPSSTTWPTISQSPSVSAQPSVSLAPSTTAWPTTSQSPSVSAQPSTNPTVVPSFTPSHSTMPTDEPSLSPSISTKPTGVPPLIPIITAAPSTSSAPSTSPELEADCSDNCPNKEIDLVLGYHDCGWGIWNDCTCQCVCDPGLCLSANSKCYDGCTTHLDFNPYGGCIPGVDCPWYRSKIGEPHCESSANFAGIHAIRETAESCCKMHFSYIDLVTCVLNSIADVVAEEAKVAQDLARTKYFYPDMHGRKNCVFSSDYQDWMMGANKEHFLFESDTQCCGNWYPARTDCPDTTAVTPKQVDYKPNASEGYFYPHLDVFNCRFGRNYPMWMMLSTAHYLYQTPEECCTTWYPAESNCPLQEDDGVQVGYFWIVDEAFYPNWKGDGCAHGNDYPEWMADPTQRDTHIFETAQECCDLWFRSKSSQCQQTIVETSLGKQVGGPPNHNGGTWYPSLNGKYQCIDGTAPGWMQAQGYKDEYVFDSHAECCKAHYCQEIRGVVQS